MKRTDIAEAADLNRLLQQAEDQARRVMIGTNAELLPIFVLVAPTGRTDIIGTPFTGPYAKDVAMAYVANMVKEGDIIAYSFLCEAWQISAPKGWKPSQPLPVAPAESPDREEIVTAFACSRKERKMVTWKTIRDAEGRCIELVEQSRSTGKGDEPRGRMVELLPKGN